MPHTSKGPTLHCCWFAPHNDHHKVLAIHSYLIELHKSALTD